MKPLNHSFQNCKHCQNRLNRYREFATEHVYAICCRLEVDCDIVAGRKVKTVLGYIVVNFELAISSSFRDIPQKILS